MNAFHTFQGSGIETVKQREGLAERAVKYKDYFVLIKNNLK